MIHPSTFSIVAHDPEQTAWGIAVASKFPAAGAVVPWARAGAGAVATQSHANTTYGPRGLEFMQAGQPASEALEQLTGEDPDSQLRQAGLVDARGGAATFTGSDCQEWAGGVTGAGYAVQGNILVGPQVVQEMAKAFENHKGELPDRLLASLLAGDRAGGDRRGRQSAAILVVKEGGGYAGFNDRWLDYRVDDHDDPVPRLIELVDLHRLYFGESPPEEKLPLGGEVLQSLQTMMAELGYYDGPAHGELDNSTSSALRAFVGNENFEDRTDLKAGLIDKPVYEFLLRRHS